MRRIGLLGLVAMAAFGCGDDAGDPSSTGSSSDAASSTSSTGASPTGVSSSGSSTSEAASSSGEDSSSSAPSGTGGAGGGATSSGGGGGGTGGAGLCPQGLSDELDDPCTTDQWTLAGSDAFELFDIATSTPGRLTIVPRQSGWYQDGHGWILYKLVEGDFALRIDVEADSLANPGSAPSNPYNSVGMLARDPASGPGAENWVMWDVGYQDTFVGTEGKTTVDSASELFLEEGARSGRLVLCRIGGTFHLFRNLDGEGEWTEQHTFPREEMPAELQVGLIANAYGDEPDLRGTIDYARFTRPTSVEECTQDLPLE